MYAKQRSQTAHIGFICRSSLVNLLDWSIHSYFLFVRFTKIGSYMVFCFSLSKKMWWGTHSSQKIILFYIVIALIACWIVLTAITDNLFNGVTEGWIKQCYMGKALKTGEAIDLFDEFTTTSESFGINEPAIFFHQTACSLDGQIELSPVQACAIESVARLNTNTKIIVLFASPQGLSTHGNESLVARALLSYSNVKFYNVNLWRYVRGSFAEKWLLEGKLFDNHHPSIAVLDFLQFFTLYKFGGTYVDLNSIITKRLELLPPNYFSAPSPNATAIDVFNLESTGIGNSVAKSLLLDYIDDVEHMLNRELNVCARVSRKLCNSEPFDMSKPLLCNGIRVLPKQTFQSAAPTTKNPYKTTPSITATTTISDAWDKILTHTYSTHSIHIDSVLTHCPIIFRTVIHAL